jgi:hypothetical protein
VNAFRGVQSNGKIKVNKLVPGFMSVEKHSSEREREKNAILK